jgi:hypothetical protein
MRILDRASARYTAALQGRPLLLRNPQLSQHNLVPASGDAAETVHRAEEASTTRDKVRRGAERRGSMVQL